MELKRPAEVQNKEKVEITYQCSFSEEQKKVLKQKKGKYISFDLDLSFEKNGVTSNSVTLAKEIFIPKK
jgi:hypothetical protein